MGLCTFLQQLSVKKLIRVIHGFVLGKLSFPICDSVRSKTCIFRLKKDIYMKFVPLFAEMNLGGFFNWMYHLPEWLYIGKTRPKSHVQYYFLLLLFLHLLYLETISSIDRLHEQFCHHHKGNSFLIPEM